MLSFTISFHFPSAIMEAMCLGSSISISSNRFAKVTNFRCWKPYLGKKKSVVYCQSGGNHAIRSTGISSVLTETSTLVTQDHSKPTLLENGNLVLNPNGKDLASVAEMHEEGIGIVKFLQGKTFFITGATGFLGKGTIFSIRCNSHLIYFFFFLNLLLFEFQFSLRRY